MKPGNLDHLMKLEEDNKNLRSVIKKMSDLMTVGPVEQHNKQDFGAARLPLKHTFSTMPKHSSPFM